MVAKSEDKNTTVTLETPPSLSKFYNELRTMKFKDIITMKNFIFVHDHKNKILPDIFESYFYKKKQ